MERRAGPERAAPWAAAAALVAMGLYRFGAMLRGLSTDFVNFPALHGNQLFNELPDSRLNSWILGWLEHALTTPSALWDANIFHPAPNMLAGSEHLFGVFVQLLPVLPFTSNAVALHQSALVLSTAVLSFTTYRSVQWATNSTWAAFLAGAFALMMPWRVTELAHLQLSSAQLLPVIWIGVVRGLLGEAKRRDLVALGICTSIQLLSSFYLAYFLTISSAVLVATVSAIARPSWRDIGRLAATVAPGFVLFALTAIPYLERQAAADLVEQYDPSYSLGLGGAFTVIAPLWPHHWPPNGELLNPSATYWTPWGIVVLAGAAVFAFGRGRFRTLGSAAERRRHSLTLALVAIVLTAFAMMIGGSLELFGVKFSTPARWLSAVIPGFSMLRGPPRWGILAAIALPILAALGAFAIDQLCRQRLWARALLAGCTAATFAWFQIPTQPAWQGADLTSERYAAVRGLPAEGALLELPWPSDGSGIDFASRAVLASTLHWRPVLNGYTGHRPPTYRFLQRIGSRLPDADALDQLRRLTELRFILLDVASLPPAQRRSWAEAARDGRLALVHQSAHTWIYEVPGWDSPSRAELMNAFLSSESRATTFSGLPRRPLELPANAGRLSGEIARSVKLRSVFDIALQVHNSSDQTWPGFDFDEEGLVRVRYTYLPLPPRGGDGREITTRIAPIEVDLPAGRMRVARALLNSPREPGAYEICVDLVQQFASATGGPMELRRLPLEPRRERIQVTGVALDTDLAKMLDKAYIAPESPAACGTEAAEPR